jgi:hypothetical protein
MSLMEEHGLLDPIVAKMKQSLAAQKAVGFRLLRFIESFFGTLRESNGGSADLPPKSWALVLQAVT